LISPAGDPATIPIVALDVAGLREAAGLIDVLGEACRFYKVGGELFTSAGPAAVAMVRDSGARVFLDLKFHDIPNTVAGSVSAARDLGVDLLTIHASGGPEMIQAAVGAAGERCGVLAVTVLTSLDGAALGTAWGREIRDVGAEVDRLADLAAAGGCHGVVCSGAEAKRVKARHGARLATLVPGIRLPGSPAGDQRRTVTPAQAVAAGARYVVLGRTVTAAPDPAAAMTLVLDDLQGRNPIT
jgi:orotidine-5'-phosphate decarboxylase